MVRLTGQLVSTPKAVSFGDHQAFRSEMIGEETLQFKQSLVRHGRRSREGFLKLESRVTYHCQEDRFLPRIFYLIGFVELVYSCQVRRPIAGVRGREWVKRTNECHFETPEQERNLRRHLLYIYLGSYRHSVPSTSTRSYMLERRLYQKAPAEYKYRAMTRVLVRSRTP